MQVGKESNVRKWSRTVAIEVYFQFEHGVFEKNVLFPFPLVIAKLIGDYFVIRRCGANCLVRFSYFVLIKKDNNFNYQFYFTS